MSMGRLPYDLRDSKDRQIQEEYDSYVRRNLVHLLPQQATSLEDFTKAVSQQIMSRQLPRHKFTANPDGAWCDQEVKRMIIDAIHHYKMALMAEDFMSKNGVRIK